MINVLSAGALGDGITDDSIAVQAALRDPSDSHLLFPEGRSFKLKRLMIPSGRTLHMEGASFVMQDSAPQMWAFSTELGAEGVRLLGGTFIGDPLSPTTCVWSIPIRLDDVRDVRVQGLRTLGSRTDGLQITGNVGCEGVRVLDCSFSGSKRNGVSIANGREISFIGCSFEGSMGNPGCGIDVEPNKPGEKVDNLTLLGCTFKDNLIGVFNQPGQGDSGSEHIISNCTFLNNANFGLIVNSVQKAAISSNAIAGSLQGCSIGSATEARRAVLINFFDNYITGCVKGLRLPGIRDSYILNNVHVGKIEAPVLGTAGDMVFLGNVQV